MLPWSVVVVNIVVTVPNEAEIEFKKRNSWSVRVIMSVKAL